VTNVYNTTIINKTTTINNVTYVNQHVNNAVTVVSHDTFVNARPVGQNVMKVSPQEIASAPVSHVVAAEPVRASVVGAGRPVTVKPPAAVINRPVVAVRTPPPPPRPIAQQQAAAGGHLNQQLLVHPLAPARPAPVNQGGRPQSEPGFKPFTQPGGNAQSGNAQVKTMPQAQPRTFEEQGTPPPENRNTQPVNRQFNAPQSGTNPGTTESHPLVRPAPPVQERTQEQEHQQEQKFQQWQQQRPASPPPAQHQSQPKPAPAPKEEKPKKSH